MASLYGQIDLTKIGDFVRQNPNAVKVVNFKDGTQHKMLNISIGESKNPDNFGNDHYLKVYVPKDQVNPNVNYFMANLKSSKTAAVTPSAPVQQPLPTEQVMNPLPSSALPSEPASNPLPLPQEEEPTLPF